MMRSVFLIAATAVLAWLLRYFIAEYGMFADAPLFRSAVEMAALGLTGLLAVQVVGWMVADLVLTDLLRVTPTGLGRVLIYVGLSLAAGIPILAYFGINLGTLLTTSAVIGAVLGLALQQPLNNVISGLSLSSDGLIQVGATIWYEGVPMEVVAVNWRHVIAQRPDNFMVALPNTKLANETLTVLPEDRPVRCEVPIEIPSNVPPDRVNVALADAFTDLPDLDSAWPMVIAPAEERSERSSMGYRIRAWVRRYADRDRVEGEILRRAWYALERARIPRVLSEMFPHPHLAEGELQWQLGALLPALSVEQRERIARNAGIYRFGSGERILLSEGSAGMAYLILRGNACYASARYLDLLEHGRSAADRIPAHPAERPSQSARLRMTASLLAEEIGPVAERVIQDVIAEARDRDDLIARLCPYLPDESACERLRALLKPRAAWDAGPGHIGRLRKDAVGRTVPLRPIEAVEEVTIAVVEDAALHPLLLAQADLNDTPEDSQKAGHSGSE